MSSDASPPVVTLLKDVPSDLEQDEFAHSTYATVLAESLRRAQRPLTVGLFGPWGVGKSSILERLRGSLSSEECAFVLFDAWRYDGETLRRHLLRETAGQLAAAGAIGPGFDPEKRLEELDVDRQATRLRIDRSWVNIIPGLAAAIVAFLGVWLALSVPQISETLLGTTSANAPLVASVAALIVLAANLTAQSIRLVPETTTWRRIEDPERFHELFRDLVAALAPERLVLAIDNLDRCSAERVVELLGTIKTYLEPAVEATGVQKHVLFVIAVDDHAVRRHLLAQEVSSGESDVAKASRNVDEYLRKVFNTSLRIAPLLHSDLREYLAARIADVRKALALTEDQERELVGLTHAALRSNPRRIIQFLNNLQIRLRLIRERERGADPLIQPPISHEPLVVAKLALIEEEWPQHFAVLLDHPHLLAEWEERARAPENEEWLEALESPLRAEWRTFAPFVRVTHGVTVSNLRAVLRYKQSHEERALPGYDEFRAAAVTGGREAVESLIASGEASPDAYAETLVRIMRDELEAQWASGARSVLEIGLTMSQRPREDLQLRLLKAAVDDPAFRPELALIPPTPMFSVAEELAPDDRRHVVDAAIRALGNLPPESVTGVAEALSPRLSWLTADQRPRLVSSFALREGPERLRILFALTGAAELPLLPELAHAIAETLDAHPAALFGPDRPAAMALVSRALDGNHDARIGEQILGALANMAKVAEGDPAQPDVLRDVLDLATHARSAPPPARMAFASGLLPSVKSAPEANRLYLADRLLEIAPVEQAVDIIFEHSNDGIRWADARLDDLDPAIRTAVAASATTAAMTTPDVRHEAIALAGRADPDGQASRTADAAVGLLETAHARTDVDWLGDALPDDAKVSFSDHLLGRLDDLPSWKAVVLGLELAARFAPIDQIAEALSVQLQRFLDPHTAADAVAFAQFLDRYQGNTHAPRAVHERIGEYVRTSLDEELQRREFLYRMLDEVTPERSDEGREAVLHVVSELGGDDPDVTLRMDQVRAGLTRSG